MVGSVKKVKVALKSAKICSSSHVPNSILKNAPKWLVYAYTVTYIYYVTEFEKTTHFAQYTILSNGPK